jgi:hypothetical protein
MVNSSAKYVSENFPGIKIIIISEKLKKRTNTKKDNSRDVLDYDDADKNSQYKIELD